MSGERTPRPRAAVASNPRDEGQFLEGAPVGWQKKLTPIGRGTPRRKQVVFVAPNGEEIKSRTRLEKYLKVNPGGPISSIFDWSAGEALRRSERLSSQSRQSVGSPAVHPPARRAKRAAVTKDLKEINETPVKRVKTGLFAEEEMDNFEASPEEIPIPSVEDSVEDNRSKDLEPEPIIEPEVAISVPQPVIEPEGSVSVPEPVTESEVSVSVPEPVTEPEPKVLSVHEAEAKSEPVPESEPKAIPVLEAKPGSVFVSRPEGPGTAATTIESSGLPAGSKLDPDEVTKDENREVLQVKNEAVGTTIKDEDTEMKDVMPEGIVKAEVGAATGMSTAKVIQEIDDSRQKGVQTPLECEPTGIDTIEDHAPSSEISTVNVIQEANGSRPEQQKNEVNPQMQFEEAKEIKEISGAAVANKDTVNGDSMAADLLGQGDHFKTLISVTDHVKPEIASCFGVTKSQEAHPAEVGVNS